MLWYSLEAYNTLFFGGKSSGKDNGIKWFSQRMFGLEIIPFRNPHKTGQDVMEERGSLEVLSCYCVILRKTVLKDSDCIRIFLNAF